MAITFKFPKLLSELTAKDILCFAYLKHNVKVIMVITLNAQNHVGNLNVSVSSTDWNSMYLKAQGSWGRLSTIRGGSGGVNIPLIPAPNPTRFFAQINFEIIMQFFLPLSPNPLLLDCTSEWLCGRFC